MALFNASVDKKILEGLQQIAEDHDLKGPSKVLEYLYENYQTKGRVLTVSPKIMKQIEIYQIEKGILTKEKVVEELLIIHSKSTTQDSLMNITLDWADE